MAVTLATLKSALKPFTRASFDTPALAKYEVAYADLSPKIRKACGGAKAGKSTPTKRNLFYQVAVGDDFVVLFYYKWAPNKAQFDAGGEGVDVLSSDGEGLGSADLDGKREVKWSLSV